MSLKIPESSSAVPAWAEEVRPAEGSEKRDGIEGSKALPDNKDTRVEKLAQILKNEPLQAAAPIQSREAEIVQKKAALRKEIEEDREGLAKAFPALYETVRALVCDELQKLDGTIVGGAIALRKSFIYWEGMKLAHRMRYDDTTKKLRLDEPTQALFTWNEGQAPFLKMVFDPQHRGTISCTKSFYDFNGPGLYVIFANMRSGGGWLERGALQEESIVMEVIDFARFLAANRGVGKGSSRSAIFIRTPLNSTPEAADAAETPLQAHPTPLLLRDMLRIREVGAGARGSNFEKGTDDQVYGAIQPRAPQHVHLLSMAAPRLPASKPEHQFAHDTLKDFFGTVMAGFVLAQGKIDPFVIHSGRLGCGYYCNNIRVAYVLQRLAAAHVGADLVLHDYGADDQKICENDWKIVSQDLKGKTLDECLLSIGAYFKEHPDAPKEQK